MSAKPFAYVAPPVTSQFGRHPWHFGQIDSGPSLDESKSVWQLPLETCPLE